MITLASDFGSPYPAAMKGVIRSETDAEIIDVAHDLPRQDLMTGAFWLREVIPTFPASVHLIVIDPGVGTGRRVLVVEAGDHRLIGPDNGVMVPVANELADDPRYYATTPSDPDSSTFHGRDVFAPLAADVHESGLEAVVEGDRFEPVTDIERIGFPEPTLRDEEAVGEVIAIDSFGNVITNVPGSFLDSLWGNTILVEGRETPVGQTYAAVPPGDELVTVGSHGRVELAVNRGRGDEAFGLDLRETVYLTAAEAEQPGDR